MPGVLFAMVQMPNGLAPMRREWLQDIMTPQDIRLGLMW